jgi:DeoR/GlpR family transcriptional regulator of sugar metabolism
MSANPEAFPGERQRLITERLAVQGRVIAAELATEFNVSEHSIRRDLGVLASAGLCKRVYGGPSDASEIAPPYTRLHRPADARTPRSRRMECSDTLNSVASSAAITRPCMARRSVIKR